MVPALVMRVLGWLAVLSRAKPAAPPAVSPPAQPARVTPGDLAVANALDELLLRVTDQPPHYDRITAYYTDGLGWPGAEPQNPPRPYRSAPGQAWCGAFAAFVHTRRSKGDGFGPLSGRRRLQSASTYKLHTYAADRCVWHRGDPATLRVLPGDLVVVATSAGKPYGDHIAVAVRQAAQGGLIMTVEGNAHGAQLGARRSSARLVEGVVLRGRATAEVVAVYRWVSEDYEAPVAP